jgi:hypothetical protein
MQCITKVVTLLKLPAKKDGRTDTRALTRKPQDYFHWVNKSCPAAEFYAVDSQTHIITFESSGMLWHVNWHMFIRISTELFTSILRIFKSFFLDYHENWGCKLFRKAYKYVRIRMTSSSRKFEFSSWRIWERHVSFMQCLRRSMRPKIG